MTTVGFVGGGRIVAAVAGLSVAAGHRVVLGGSRGPQTLKDLVADLGSLASAATAEQAAEAGDVVVVRTPLGAYPSLPVEPMAGKVVLDACNYDPQRDGHIADLDAGRATSSGLLQRHLSESRIVKVFNNILAKNLRSLARPHGAGDRSALPIAGDDDQANCLHTLPGSVSSSAANTDARHCPAQVAGHDCVQRQGPSAPGPVLLSTSATVIRAAVMKIHAVMAGHASPTVRRWRRRFQVRPRRRHE